MAKKREGKEGEKRGEGKRVSSLAARREIQKKKEREKGGEGEEGSLRAEYS